MIQPDFRSASVGIRPPERTGAALRVEDKSICDRRRWREFCRSVFPSPVQDGCGLRGQLKGKGFPHLSDDEKTVEHTEGNCRNSEKIHPGNGFTVVAKKPKPAPAGLRVPRRSFHPAGNGSFGHLKTKHEKLAVDAQRSPGGFSASFGGSTAEPLWISAFFRWAS